MTDNRYENDSPSPWEDPNSGSDKQPEHQSGDSPQPSDSAASSGSYDPNAAQNTQQNPYGDLSQGQPSGSYGSTGQPPYGGQQTPNSGFPTTGNPQQNYGTPGYGQPQYQPSSTPAGANMQQGSASTPYGAAAPVGSYQQSSYALPSVGVAGFNSIVGAQMVTRGSGLDILQAIKYGFKATFARPLLWLLGSFLFLLVSSSNSIIQSIRGGFDVGYVPGIGSAVFELIIILVVFFFYPIIFAALLVQIDGQEVSMDTIKARLNYPQTLLTSLLVSLVFIIPLGISFFFIVSSASFGYSMAASLGTIFLSLGVFLLFTLFIGVFVFLAVYLTVDGQAFGFDAIKKSCKTIAGVYFPWIGLVLLSGLLAASASLITCGLASIIMYPVCAHAIAHGYRQVANLPYPAV